LLNRPDGQFFKTRTVENSLQKKIKVGDVVTYCSSSSSKNGIPIKPVIIKQRPDLSVADVLENLRKPFKKRSLQGNGAVFTTEHIVYSLAHKQTWIQNLAKFPMSNGILRVLSQIL
jgi:ribose 5-phosphate isomerase